MERGGTGAEASHAVVDRALRNKLLAGSDASSAQDAFGEVTNDERIRLVKRTVVGHGIQVRIPYPEFTRNFSQQASVPLAADDTGFRVFGYHQPYDIAPVLQNTLCVRQYAQPVSDRGDARCQQTSAFLILYDTNAASAMGLQCRMVAKSRNIDPRRVGSFENGCTGSATDFLSVY